MRIATWIMATMMFASHALAMELSSHDLKNGAQVPLEQVYTRCGGGNTSPGLSWSGAPSGTNSIALTLIDTSVKPSGWTHWIVIGLPPGTTSLPKGVSSLPDGARQIVSDFGEARYDGPCPPQGSGMHRYEFTVWALKSAPAIESGVRADALAAELNARALAKASIDVTYQR